MNEDFGGFKAVIDAHERELQDHTQRIGALEKDRRETNVSQGVLMTKIESLGEKIDRLNNKVDMLEQKPSKRWDTLIASLITGIVGLFLGLMAKGAI